MDVQQLKLLAGRLRGLLEQQNHELTHGQSLDVIAALPGLRNWPEVMAFPLRVAESELTETATSRLSRRLRSRFGVEADPLVLLQSLDPEVRTERPGLPELWPSGPDAGIYVTTSQKAIEALMRNYDDATDGAPLYAESAGDRFDSAIDLGEQGLWSQGLSRVPSGTLIVVGPIEMTQEEWESNTQRLQQACLHVHLSGHRVAVLFHTPAPDQLHSDALLLVKSDDPVMDDLHEAFKGVVTDDGDLLTVTPFVPSLAKPVVVPSPEPEVALPPAVVAELKAAVARQPYGIIVLGSNEFKAPRAVLLESLLSLTDAAGPVARIRPDHRHDFDGDPPLSDRFAGVPVMPSVESAYAHGYKRMVIENGYGASEHLLKYGKDVCFLVGAFSAEVEGAFMSAMSPRDLDKPETLEHLIAVIGVARFVTKKGDHFVSDMFVNPGGPTPAGERFEAIVEYLNVNRVLRWQDGLEDLLVRKLVSVAQVKKDCPNHHTVLAYLGQRKNMRAKLEAH
jgi:hypothetical protein